MPYRRPDQYYIDLYDRVTIAGMKEREKKEAEELEAVPQSDAERKTVLALSRSIGFDSSRNYGVLRARDRKGFIQKLMAGDERMDRLIDKTPVPKGPECAICKMLMRLCNHFFDNGETPILFVFECPNGHAPPRVIYPDGREYFFLHENAKNAGVR
jgi:hypothetical protein